ncbi:MAG: glutaredoxin 3 [Thiothrix sp.]|nr:glutaredoxin 3 [Thiothrix sp.]HPE61040.1 glutaredoxin 3 [Thiolinea sp.]
MSTPRVVMYSTRFCPYCMRARSLLKRRGVDHEEIGVGWNQALWAEMRRLSGRDTVPQIFIDGQPVGGYDDLAALEQSGELDRLLGRI